MKMNTDKDLEKLVEKVMQETSLENPSTGFTSKVMFEVLSAKMNDATVYKPLISKKSWFIILGIIIVLIVYTIISGNVQSVSWYQNLDFSIKANDILKNLPVIKFSVITFYAIALLPVMLFIQIKLLKNYFNKRIEA
ncbi:MAG: hypothetical protein ABI405_09290 [Parafilimonas sp.]